MTARRSGATVFARLAVLAVLAALGVGCAGAAEVEGERDATGVDAPALDDPDPHGEELATSIEELRDVVAAIRTHVVSAAEAESLRGVRAETSSALAAFLDDPSGTRGGLYPAQQPDRESDGERADALTMALRAARQVDGELGRSVVEVLRDPIAGDLGAWERDPVGVIEQARSSVTGARSVEDALESVQGLAGDGVRALAWVFLADEATSLDTAKDAAERADAHLGVLEIAIEILLRDNAGEFASDPGDDSRPDDAESSGNGDADPGAGP